MVSSKYNLLIFTIFRPRFGLFSQPASNAIGDTNAYPTKLARKDADGEVITDPRNFYTKRMRAGKAEDVYFSKGTYNCIGDPFVMAGKMSMRTMVKDSYLKGGHDKDFCPAKNIKERIYKQPYEYIPL
jgi:hypothetical protein